MREYGQLRVGFWNHPDFASTSDQGKLLAVYLLTCQHCNALGCFRLPDGYIMEDLKWSKDTVSKRFLELVGNGFCVRDEQSWLLMPKFLRWNKIQNPKCSQAVESLFDCIPCTFRYYGKLINSILNHGQHLSLQFRNRLETLSEQYQDDFQKTESEQEQEQEQEHISCANEKHDADFETFWTAYPPRGTPPMRRNRDKALKAWNKARKAKDLPAIELVLSCIDREKRTRQWRDPQYIPMAATWLNSKPWKDEAPKPEEILYGTEFPEGDPRNFMKRAE